MMNESTTSAWSGAEQYDPMASVAEQDFGSLIDLDNFDLDFNIDYANGSTSQESNQQLTELADSLDVQHLQNFTSPLQHGHNDATSQAQSQQPNAHIGGAMSQAGNNFYNFNMPAFTQPHQSHGPFSTAHEPAFHAHAGVPPTPNSVEMHGDAARYLQQMDPQTRAFFEQRFQLRKEEVAFTPLVSPAVTPHETRFQVPEFTTVPGAYFSPLTSPALQAQQQKQQQSYQPGQYNTSGSSAATSPADVDMDILGESAVPQAQTSRKLRSNNKRSAPRSSNASARVRQSPIVRPSRRKATLSSTIPPKEVTDLLEEVQRSNPTQPSSNALPGPQTRDSSEAESISPEPLTEMGPPPKPGSVTHSPAIMAKRGQAAATPIASSQGVCPATPASLMRIQQSPNFTSTPETPILDDFSLPEAAASAKPSLSRIETAMQEDDQSTPRLSARKTPKLGPLSTPSGGAAMSGKPSPMLSAVASPTSPGFAMNGARKLDGKGSRTGKKRNSTSSALVSPALRPKISPSIKPLLPEGALTDDTHALLLASKSNYQNILDGTTVPGVNYPTSLSTNLTSKRTSHKIAEQGRRNRINTALQEMQALLPSPNIKAGDAKSPDGDLSSGGTISSAAQQSNSKAAKVESAIDYIKQLQKQCSDQDKLLNEKDQEMEALRKELAALKKSSSSSPEQELKQEKLASSGSEAENDT